MSSAGKIASLMAQIELDAASQPETVFGFLGRLLNAPAPANSCLLPGAVGDVIRAIAGELGLSAQTDSASGNLIIEIGEPEAELDLLLSAHMDRPCFRVLDLAEASLYPLCAIRVPGDGYQCGAVALRYAGDVLQVGARGRLHFRETAGGHQIRFQAETGSLEWGDTLMMQSEPSLKEGMVTGAGLDNAAGVLLALLAARMLNQYAGDLVAGGGKIVFAFTDQEEGPPVGLFGQGAARLAHGLPQPRLGFINIDGHNLEAATGHLPGVGASHAFVSGRGRGSVVPLDYQALAESLAGAVNQRRAGTVRLNYGYVSRSDDMLLSTWSRCLGLIGVPLANAHTTEEAVALGDLVAAVYWISAYVGEVLGKRKSGGC